MAERDLSSFIDAWWLDMSEVMIAEYDPQWPILFEREAQAIREVLGERLVGIEHFGSTSVPGLAAKPIIDIMIATRSKEDWPKIVEPLGTIGFACWLANTDPTRMFFAKGTPPHFQQRTHHLIVSEFEGHHWQRLTLVRDYFRTHLEEARQYETFKRELGERFPGDRGGYTKAKGPYLDRIENLARAERDLNSTPPAT